MHVFFLVMARTSILSTPGTFTRTFIMIISDEQLIDEEPKILYRRTFEEVLAQVVYVNACLISGHLCTEVLPAFVSTFKMQIAHIFAYHFPCSSMFQFFRRCTQASSGSASPGRPTRRADSRSKSDAQESTLAIRYGVYNVDTVRSIQ